MSIKPLDKNSIERRYEELGVSFDNIMTMIERLRPLIRQQALADVLDRINNEIDDSVSIKDVCDIILDEIAKEEMLKVEPETRRGK